MKISNLTETATPSSMPDPNTAAPKFGRSDEMLESGVGTTTSGGMASVSKPMGKMRTRGQGSMFKGISTSSKYANSKKAGISEDVITEGSVKQLMADLREMPESEFKATYGKSKLEVRNELKQPKQSNVNEDELSEEQLQAKKLRDEIFKKAKDRELGNRAESREIMAKEATGRGKWDSNSSDYEGDYGGSRNWGRREREDDEHHEIDRRREQQLAQYTQSGKFWLKLKDSQRHLPAGPFTGKQAATTAALELLKKQPELKGNLVITAYGPGERQGVAEGSEEDMSKEANAMATGKCPHCHGPVQKKEHPTLTQYHCAKCGIRASIDKQSVAEGWKGELAGGTIGGIAGNLAGSALGGSIGGIVGGAVGGAGGGIIGRELTKEEQLNELAPILAAGARLVITMAPKIAQVLKNTGKATAKAAAPVTKSGAEIAAKNADKIGVGLGAYEIGSSAADIAKAITAKVGTALEEKTIMELAQVAFKFAIPAGIVLAILYGGKKVIDSLFNNSNPQQGVAEGFNGEYDDEAGMFKNNLQTIQRVSMHLEKAIADNENLPEWCQEKIGVAKSMVVTVMDYIISQHENGIDPKQDMSEESKGLWANIHAKRERIKNGSREKMRKPGSKGAPTASALRKSAK